MPENQLYPVVSDLLPLQKIPSELESIKEVLEKLLGKVYFKDLIVGKSYHGEAGYYTLTLISLKPLGLNIPFVNDLKLIVNPSTDGSATEIPITFDYSWEVLKYFSSFNFDSFDNSVGSIFNILFELASITKEELLQEVLTTFFEDYNALALFVTQFNTDNGAALTLDNNQSESNQIQSVLHNIDANDTNFTQYIVTKYVEKGGFEQGFENLKSLLARWYGDINSSDISDILKIKFRFSMPKVSLGLLFPRKWLQPLDANFQRLPEPEQSKLEFNAGALEYSTQSGFQFIKENSFSLTRSEIANTGIIIEFEGLKVDLANDSNIPEAIADGRPENFKGVYAQLAAITLPPRWFDKTDSHPGTTARVAGYDILVGTGGLSGTIALEAVTIPTDGTITDYYGDCFTFQYPIAITANTKIIEIADSSDLLIKLNELNGTSYNFNFPLKLTTVEGKEEPIANQTEYANFLATCETTGAPSRLIKKIGGKGFEVWFTAFDITFKQNKVVESNILGGLKIPRLKDANGDIAEIEIFGHFDDSGDFLVSASEQDGFKPIGIKDVIQFHLKTVELGSEDGNFFIGCACDLEFPSPLMKKLLGEQRIQIDRMRIYSDGSIEIVSGVIPVPINFSINLGPVEVAITNMSIGSYQQEYKGETRKYVVIGFDGAVNLGNLGFEARGKGMQYYFTVDSGAFHSEFRIQTIEADLIIPGSASAASATAIINGYLSIPQPGESKEYSGGVSVKLPKAKISGSAALSLQPKYPAFIVDVSIGFPTPIPVTPALGISGFRGLLGFRYIAEKEAVGLKSGPEGDTWYDYYTYPQRGVDIRKFRGPDKSEKAKSGFSIGAGATLASLDGQVFSARLMFILSVPSLFVFDGRANILSEALGLDDPNDPPFFAFIAIGDGSVEIGAGVNFRHPKSNGNIIDINVGMEAYFPTRNSSAWYIHIGSRAKPNKARILKILTLQSYLELSSSGMALGARADFNFKKSFGPASVKADLYAEVGGRISFSKPQIGGYVAAGGDLEVSFWFITVGIRFNAIFGAEAVKPFLIYASVEVSGRIKIGFIKISKSITVDIKWEFNKDLDTTPIQPLPESLADQNIKGISMLNGQTFDLFQMNSNTINPNSDAFKNNAPVLPLDTYIDLKFQKPLDPRNITKEIGGTAYLSNKFVELSPPQETVNGRTARQVTHKYSIKEISLQAWNTKNSNWEDYNPYKAITPVVDRGKITLEKFGHWQKIDREYNAIRVLGDHPFSFTQQGEPGWYIPEQIGLSSMSLFCQDTYDYNKCANWRNTRVGRRYSLTTIDTTDFETGITSNFSGFHTKADLSYAILENADSFGGNRTPNYAKVSNARSANFNFSRGLQFENRNPLVLKYSNPSIQVSFKLITGAQNVSFTFYKSIITEGTSGVSFEKFDQIEVTASELEANPKGYVYTSKDPNNKISQVLITPNAANQDAIGQLYVEINALQDTIVDATAANDTATVSESNSTLTKLVGNLNALENQSCRTIQIPCTGIGSMMLTDDFIVGKKGANQTITQKICNTVLFEACWLTQADWEVTNNLPSQEAISEEFEAGTDAIRNRVAPIWRPDTAYRIQFKLADKVQDTENEWDYFYGFATAGPIGHYDPNPNLKYKDYLANRNKSLVIPQKDKDIYAHATLRQYIDYKRSYPNANGNLLRAKPLFYGTSGGNNKISIYFSNAQAYHMFQNWEKYLDKDTINTRMEIVVKDPVEDITLQNPPEADSTTTEIPRAEIKWTPESNALFPHEYQLYNNIANSNESCVGSPANVIIPKRYVTEVTVNNMKPLKMYTAIINTVYKPADFDKELIQEVHNFVFQTSRYENFYDQITSYKLKMDGASTLVNDAVFNISIAVTEKQVNTAYNIVAGKADATSTNLEAEKLDLFDRVIEGVLGMTPLDPAITTEFNFIKNTETQETIALLIRNPEPFNDPKIPLDIIEREAAFAVYSGTTIDPNYKIIYSKDYAQILVMYNRNDKTAILADKLDMKFNYLRWNGDTYQINDNVMVKGIETTKKG